MNLHEFQAIYELQRCGVSARGVIANAVVGRVADEIVDAAVKDQVDEILIGSSPRTWLGKLISSSVAPRVLKLSAVPVFAVPTVRLHPQPRPDPARTFSASSLR